MRCSQQIAIPFLPQHFLLFVKVCIAYAIPDMPNWVATEMAKIEYRRRQLEKRSFSISGSFAGSLDTEDRGIQTESPISIKVHTMDLPMRVLCVIIKNPKLRVFTN